MYPLILTLDSHGHPIRWSTWKEGVIYQCKELIGWSLGNVEIYRGGTNRMTGEQSIVSVPSIIAVKGVVATKRRTPPLTNRNLFGRDRNTCAYCGHVFDDVKLTRDHIVPVSKGGEDSYMNCVTACKRCNNKKDDKSLTEFGRPLLYVPYVPDRCEGLILANRRILSDQMEFLTQHLPRHSRVFAADGMCLSA